MLSQEVFHSWSSEERSFRVRCAAGDVSTVAKVFQTVMIGVVREAIARADADDAGSGDDYGFDQDTPVRFIVVKF